MKTVIFYYSGTGNSLWSARLLAERLGDAKLQPMKGADALAAGDAEAVGFVFPVHIWGLPVPVVHFIEKLSLRPRVYLFALAVNAGQVSGTLLQLRRVLAERGLAAYLRAMPGLHPVVPSGVDPVRQKNAGLRTLPPPGNLVE